MLDHPSNSDSGNRRRSPRRAADPYHAPSRPKKSPPASPPTEKEPPKRKGAIINQRGPSEIDRALRMSQAVKPRPAGADRKVAEGSTGRGTVVRIDKAKGYGFLVDAAGEQRFFHRSAVLDGGFANLKEQQTVEFEARGDERGARAIKVRPTNGSASVPKAPAGKAPQRPQSSPKTPKTGGWRSDLMPFRSGSTPSTTGRRRP